MKVSFTKHFYLDVGKCPLLGLKKGTITPCCSGLSNIVKMIEWKDAVVGWTIVRSYKL